MNSKFLFLPFLAVFTAAIASVLSSTLTQYAWASYVAWGISATFLLAWIALDNQGIKKKLSQKGAKYSAGSSLNLILGLVVIVGLGFLTSKPRFNLSVDVTRDSLNTLSDQTVKLVAKFDKDAPVEVLTFFDDDAKKEKFKQLLGLYEGVQLQTTVEHIDPKADPTKAIAEGVTTVDTVILKYASQNARITDFTEEKMTNSLMKLLKSGSKKIYFTEGHGEKPLDGQEAEGFKLIQDELLSERFEVDSVNLLEAGKVPEDAELIIIAGPKYDFHDNEIKLLSAYLRQAKPVLFMFDAMTDIPNLARLSQEFGVTVNNDMLILRPDDPRAQLLGQNNALVTEFDEFSPATKDFAAKGAVTLVVPNARSLGEKADNTHGMKTTLVAKTADIIIAVNGVRSPGDLEGVDANRISAGPFSLIAISEGQVGGDRLAENESSKDEKVDAAGEKAEASKELRMAVVGSSDIVSNLGVQRGENVDMFLNLVNYLLQDDDYISIRPKDLTASQLDVSGVSSQLVLLFFAYLYPTLFLGGGVFYWMRRRKA